MDLKEKLENIDRLGYEPELLELLSVVTLMRNLENDLRKELDKNDVDSVEYERVVNKYQTAIYKRILSKLDIEDYYDKGEGMSEAFYDFEDRKTSIEELIRDIKDSIRYIHSPAIEVAEN